MTVPCAVRRPRLWMSLSNIRRPASRWPPPRPMPNSAACLMVLIASPPALARPMILAFDACACTRLGGKVLVGEWMPHRAQHLAAGRLDEGRGVALERVAERIIRRDE